MFPHSAHEQQEGYGGICCRSYIFVGPVIEEGQCGGRILGLVGVAINRNLTQEKTKFCMMDVQSISLAPSEVPHARTHVDHQYLYTTCGLSLIHI